MRTMLITKANIHAQYKHISIVQQSYIKQMLVSPLYLGMCTEPPYLPYNGMKEYSKKISFSTILVHVSIPYKCEPS